MRTIARIALSAALLGTACEGITAPPLPEELSVAGVAFTASLELVDGDPRAFRVIASAENRRESDVSFGLWASGCMVRVRAYGGRVPEGMYVRPAPGIDCATIGTTLQFAPGERKVLPDQPVVDLAEVLGDKFAPGQYRISAVIPVHGESEPVDASVEVLAGDITVPR